jgi:hypothetical protein
MKKLLFIPILLSLSNLAFSGPYLMSKHEFKMKDSDYDKTVNHVRLGNSWKTESGLKLYGEVGVIESIKNGNGLFDGDAGTSYEFGFKKKITDSFSWKGKWEGMELPNSSHGHKIEIKTKWKF